MCSVDSKSTVTPVKAGVQAQIRNNSFLKFLDYSREIRRSPSPHQVRKDEQVKKHQNSSPEGEGFPPPSEETLTHPQHRVSANNLSRIALGAARRQASLPIST